MSSAKTEPKFLPFRTHELTAEFRAEILSEKKPTPAMSTILPMRTVDLFRGLDFDDSPQKKPQVRKKLTFSTQRTGLNKRRSISQTNKENVKKSIFKQPNARPSVAKSKPLNQTSQLMKPKEFTKTCSCSNKFMQRDEELFDMVKEILYRVSKIETVINDFDSTKFKDCQNTTQTALVNEKEILGDGNKTELLADKKCTIKYNEKKSNVEITKNTQQPAQNKTEKTLVVNNKEDTEAQSSQFKFPFENNTTGNTDTNNTKLQSTKVQSSNSSATIINNTQKACESNTTNTEDVSHNISSLYSDLTNLSLSPFSESPDFLPNFEWLISQEDQDLMTNGNIKTSVCKYVQRQEQSVSTPEQRQQQNVSTPDVFSRSIFCYNEMRNGIPILCTPKLTNKNTPLMTPGIKSTGTKLLSRKVQAQLMMLNQKQTLF